MKASSAVSPVQSGTTANRVLIIDDHDLSRFGIRSIVEKSGRYVVSGEAGDSDAAMALAEKHQPDVVTIGFWNTENLQLCRRIFEVLRNPAVLLVLSTRHRQVIQQTLALGIRGYVSASAAGRELIPALDTLAVGGAFFSPWLMDTLQDLLSSGRRARGWPASPSDLTRRETEVLVHLSSGKSNKEIAAELEISVSTVEAHRAHIMEKLDLRSAADLTRWSIREGLIEA